MTYGIQLPLRVVVIKVRVYSATVLSLHLDMDVSLYFYPRLGTKYAHCARSYY